MSGRSERPRPPHQPEPAECCGEGCVNCVFDVYETQMERYRAALEQWRQQQPQSTPGDPQSGVGSAGVNR